MCTRQISPGNNGKDGERAHRQAMTEDGVVISVCDVLAGLYVIDVADVNAALDWAQRIPTAKYGKVEIVQSLSFRRR